MTSLLQSLYGYHAWANAELFDKLERENGKIGRAEMQTAQGLIGHYYVVSKIFAGHLEGASPSFRSNSLEEALPLHELREAVEASDRWYLDYVRSASPATLSKPVAFTFTDGQAGRMTREEMLIHVAVHAGYHRGEIGRILKQISISPPWDTFAVYVHQADPARRLVSDVES